MGVGEGPGSVPDERADPGAPALAASAARGLRSGSPSGPSADVERLTRWRAAGGGWRVLARTPTSLVVALVTCDGAEEMDRVVSSDPALRAYVDAEPGEP